MAWHRHPFIHLVRPSLPPGGFRKSEKGGTNSQPKIVPCGADRDIVPGVPHRQMATQAAGKECVGKVRVPTFNYKKKQVSASLCCLLRSSAHTHKTTPHGLGPASARATHWLWSQRLQKAEHETRNPLSLASDSKGYVLDSKANSALTQG